MTGDDLADERGVSSERMGPHDLHERSASPAGTTAISLPSLAT